MGRILTTLSLAGLVTGLAAAPASAQQAAGKVAFINSRLVLAAALASALVVRRRIGLP